MKKVLRRSLTCILTVILVFTLALQPAFADDVSVPEAEIALSEEEPTAIQEDEPLEPEVSLESRDELPEEQKEEPEESSDILNDTESEEPEESTEAPESTEESTAEDTMKLFETVTGTFDHVDGYEVATIRYKSSADGTGYYFADFTFNSDSGKYTYSFDAPYAGFSAVQGTEMRGQAPADDATVIAYYYSLSRWDGAVDVSWYNETDSDFYIYDPAQLAGVAAIVNGNIDADTENYEVKGTRSDLTGAANKGLPDCIVSDLFENTSLPAQGVGDAYKGRMEHDFANRTIHIMSDLDMGGADGSDVYMASGYDIAADDPNMNWNRNLHKDEYPNWTPIGGEYLMDVEDTDTMNIAFFNGFLDGHCHSIRNIYCYRWSYRITDGSGRAAFAYSQGIGLIGAMACLYSDDRGEEAQPSVTPGIKDLSLSGFIYGRRMVGGFVGVIGGGSYSVEGSAVSSGITLENLANHAYVYCTDAKGLGGIAGRSNIKGSIINCYNTGRIQANYAAPSGGIIGANEEMSIFCCYNTGDIITYDMHGRGIGADDAGTNYTVDNCYYLYGCSDDTNYPGYRDLEAGNNVYVDVTPLTSAQMTDGTMLAGLNQNGIAYVAGDDGWPVLYWERNSGSGTIELAVSEGGSVSAYTSRGNVSSGDSLANGTVVYLDNTSDTGWKFRYYTLNGNQSSGYYVTVNGASVATAVFESSKAGVLKINDNYVCNIEVTKTGVIEEDGSLVNVTNYPVSSGDSIYEGDQLTVHASVKDGMVPDDPDLIYSYFAGMEICFDYGYTYTGEDEEVFSVYTYTVTSKINEDDVSLTLDVKPRTTQKLWRYSADTSWFSASASEFTLNSASQLAGLAVLVDDGNNFSGKTIKLGSDISFTNTDGTNGRRFWDGMGNTQVGFAGTFDGQGHKITDFHSNQNALFSYLSGTSASAKATVKNLDIYGTAEGANACGLAYSVKNANIINCHTFMAISGTSGYIAGIAGNVSSNAVISDCVNYGNITCATAGSTYIGGIAGKIASGCSADGCFNRGDITVNTSNLNFIGGIAGQLAGPLTRCANYGNIESCGRYTGGIAGQANSANAVVSDCYNAGELTLLQADNASDSIGGLVGFGSIYVISDSFNVGNVLLDNCTTANIGGLIGKENKNSKSSTDNVYMLDSTCAYVDNSVSYENLSTANYHKGMKTASAEEFASANGVISVINSDACFALNNGEFPELTDISDLHVHSGGSATCTTKAICDICGLEYGQFDENVHLETLLVNKTDPAWVYDGNTGDTQCLYCGTIIEHGEVIPADKTANAITINIIESGETTATKTYTREEFDALKQTKPIAYAYGTTEGGEMMAATEYVTLDTIYSEFGYTVADVEKIVVNCVGTSDHVEHDSLVSKCEYHEGGEVYSAPAAIAMNYTTGYGTLEAVASIARASNSLRFGYGISSEQYEQNVSVGGRRCVSPVTSVDIYIVKSEREGVNISGSITGFSGSGTVTVSLTASGETEPLMSYNGTDNYTLDGVEAGTYTLSVLAGKKYVQHDYEITVGEEDLIQDVLINLLGDVDQNGRINSNDITMLQKHMSRVSTITDEYALKLCDTDRDGRIRAGDVTILLKYTSRIISDF